MTILCERTQYFPISQIILLFFFLRSVRKLSKMTEKLSKSMLDVVGVATGSVMAPLVKSQAGKAFFSMVPGEVLLASLDAFSK